MEETKLTGKSKDIILDNVSKLKKLFPEIIVEDKIDFDALRKILGENVNDSKEKFNFTWSGKTQAINESQKQSTGTLRPCKEESKNWDKTRNIYIEGDNLEILKLLQKTYYNSSKVIYMDPPYNTGKDILYKNDYSDNLTTYLKITGQVDNDGDVKLSTNTESNGRFHSNWINMMYSRIKLARNLLTDDGCLVITIDHYELDNLIKICNEIFGEENKIGIVSVVNNPMGRQNAKFFSVTNEFMLVYAKNIDNFKFNQVVISEEKMKEFQYQDNIGSYSWRPLLHDHKKGLRENKPKNWYPMYVSPDLSKFSIEEIEGYYKVMPISKKGVERSWLTSKENTQERIDNDELMAKKEGNDIVIYRKFRAQERIFTVWNDKKYNSNHNGSRFIQELFGTNLFDFPKSIYAVEDILKLVVDDNALVMDFFSGSATTAHAVMELNSLNNSNMRFLMAQLPFKTDEKSQAYKDGYSTISEIGKERIRRAGEKIVKETGNKDLDIGFKVFKLDSSNLEKWEPDYNNIQQSLFVDNIKPGRSNEDLVYEIMLKYGIDLTLPLEKHDNIYSIGFGALVSCLDDNITKEITEPILKLTKNSSISRVVFKDSGFKSDAEKTNIKEILKTNNISEFITI